MYVYIFHELYDLPDLRVDLDLVGLDTLDIETERINQFHQDVRLRLLLIVTAHLVRHLRELKGISPEFPMCS